MTGLGDFLGSLQKYLHCSSTKPELVCSIKCVFQHCPKQGVRRGKVAMHPAFLSLLGKSNPGA